MPTEFLCIGGPLDGVRGTSEVLEAKLPRFWVYIYNDYFYAKETG